MMNDKITIHLNMKWNNANLRNRLYLIAAIVLLVGSVSALLIYLTADDASENIMLYEYEHSKMYKHNLERYSGKWGVLADDFTRWFSGLWHGKALASTIAFISIFISLCFFYVGYNAPSDTDIDDSGENRPDGNG
jgi:multisubunit Na+/H+ antiporter MnhB subunit